MRVGKWQVILRERERSDARPRDRCPGDAVRAVTKDAEDIEGPSSPSAQAFSSLLSWTLAIPGPNKWEHESQHI